MELSELYTTNNLMHFLSVGATPFQAIAEIVRRLEDEGFRKPDGAIKAGGKYYEVQNGSAIIAYSVPEDASGFMIAASHSDSPMFKLKPDFESVTSSYVRLDTERYGGALLSTWFDRPLSVAGRVVVREEDGSLLPLNVDLKRPVCVIPSVAIHFNREANNGVKINPAVDTFPLVSSAEKKGGLMRLIASEAGVKPEDIVAHDLFVYHCATGIFVGADEEYFLAPRIDNLMCAYGTLEGFLSADPKAAAVYAVFDNEETGSDTKQGAGSVWLSRVLQKIAACLGKDCDEMLKNSLFVSADNGHALHPDHPEFSDPLNAPKMNGGIVIKTNANQKYATDAVSTALFTEICRRADVPTQTFANRSDLAGGSTLGSISNTHVPVNTVDIGLAQLAMHSSCETAGAADTGYLIRASKAFYESRIDYDGKSYRII